MEEISEIFVRKKSGLRRSASAWDVLLFNMGIISIGFAITFLQFYGPGLYPGGSLWLASLITTVGMVFVGMGFYFWSLVMPRSGGSYVFLSRAIHPALGFAISWIEVLVTLFYTAFAGILITNIGVTTALTTMGAILKDKGLIDLSVAISSNPYAILTIALLVIILAGISITVGIRKYFFIQKIVFGVAIMGTLLTLAILLLSDHTSFLNNFKELFPSVDPAQVIEIAKGKGWDYKGFDWGQTIKVTVWPIVALIAGIFSIGISGEIRKVEKSQLFGILGAIIFSGVTFIIISVLANNVFGYELQGALSYNFLNLKSNSTPTEPYFPLLLGIATRNVVLTMLLSISFIAWIYLWIPALLTYANRAILYWSFDRLLPEKVSRVSDRYGTPITAILISLVITIIFLVLYLFTPWFGTLSLFQVLLVGWSVVLIAGVVFPYRKKTFFENSPAANYSINKVPLMSVFCIIGALFLILEFYLLWNDAVAAGHDLKTILTIVITFMSGIVAYFIIKRLRLKQGIDIGKAFEEIPIE